MNTAHVEEDTLNMHFDGELSPAEAGAVQRHLTTCAECTKRLASLGKLRDLISMSAIQAASAVDFEVAFGAIDQATRTQPSATWSERAVVWVRESLEYQPSRVWVPAGGMALAAAAALVLALRANTAGPSEEVARRAAPRDERAEKREPMMLAEAPAAPTETEEEGSADSEVVQVDFGSNTGTVFEIALADGASTPVVWINDEE